VNRQQRRHLDQAALRAQRAKRALPGTVARRADMLSPGDVVAGTGASGALKTDLAPWPSSTRRPSMRCG
jgi:hypothetical protein